MSLYPSLEDMKVDQMLKAQQRQEPSFTPSAPYPTLSPRSDANPNAPNAKLDTLYPTLNDWMGLSLTSQELAVIQNQSNAVSVPQSQSVSVANNQMIAPISSTSVGLMRANVTYGIREVVVCKGNDSKVGIRVKDINKGVFVVFVQNNSPAAMVGLRFGDQILQINGENVAGYTTDKVHAIIKKAGVNDIHMIVRDRPFERTITLHKDSAGQVGFSFKNGKINAIVKDSSAARNGLLTEHNFLEINGQNVVGMNDKSVRALLESGGDVITLTVMPSFVFEHMMKQMANSLVKKLMDHSIPDL